MGIDPKYFRTGVFLSYFGVFKKIPDGLPVSGVHFAVEDRLFDLDTVPGDGVIVEVLSVSLDPYLRTRMRDANIPIFSDPYIIGKAMTNIAIGSILRSDNSRFFPGDVIHTELPFAQYASLTPQELQGAIKIDNPYDLDCMLY